jgi:hypothetical protein
MPLLSNMSRWFSGRSTEDDEEMEQREQSPFDTGTVLRPQLVDFQSVVTHERPGERRRAGSTRRIVELLGHALEPNRQKLLGHEIYDAVNTLPRLRTFMGVHVYAVWDFMCLLKRLQRDFTSLGPLWVPPQRPELARFINGVVHGEESDVGPDGQPASHLQMYLTAMDEVGATTVSMRRYLSLLEYGAEPDLAMTLVETPLCARVFVSNTLELAARGSTIEVLASFLYGREDLIPAMFAKILPRWRASRSARTFTYYVDRHIELDGDEHGPAAQRALAELCGDDLGAWETAYHAANQALRARIELWDSVVAELK